LAGLSKKKSFDSISKKMIGKKILNYRISRLIGEGGMATVYEAIHEKLDTKVAIKVLNPVLTANAKIRQRFLQEAKMIASLNHQNIVKVIDYEEQSDFLAIVMEYLDGSDLSDYIKENGKLPLQESVRLFMKVLDAFSYAHSKGIVHRDVKPSNIFLVGNLEPKILDFGIAKMLETDAALTHTGTQMGTPVYMSPELVNADKNIDHRSDIYSLGVTLFYILQGQPPYDATTISNFQIFNKIYAEPLPLLSGIPDIFNQIIQKATAKKPGDRFQSCNEFRAALADLELEQDQSKHVDERKSSKNPAPSTTISDDRTLIDEVASKPEPKAKTPPPKKEEKAKIQAPASKPVENKGIPENKPKSKIFTYLILAFVIISIGIFAYMKFTGGPSEEEKWRKLVQDSTRYADSLANLKNKAEADSIANAESLKLALIRQNTADSLEQEKASAIVWTDKKHGYFTDVRDGQKYDVIKIGGQTWMAQNFNLATPNGSWCYENNQSNCKTYGRLYNWETARKSAPLGWHLPTKGEQETLIQGLYEVHKEALYNELLPGGSIGFNAPLAGQRTETGEFGGINSATFFWSSSPSANYATWAYYIELTSYNTEVSYTSGERKCGYSIRYVKN
jgi:uncharacterized protein (TIGR02145 family)